MDIYDALNEAWAATQNLDTPPTVDVPRSTAVGDVVVVDDREAWQVEPIGWRRADMAIVRIMRRPD